ncbi:unnamed protein product [Polarella glacialis]|uniref:Uncharacterized protein n=1 Tax=Polarella glacialis TaxID=89957 RepID=A0A813FDR9_POLGL|nr:unnamed protein product [Polarella glacialis]
MSSSENSDSDESSDGCALQSPFGMGNPFASASKSRRVITEEEKPSQELYDSARQGNLERCKSLLSEGLVKDVNWRRPKDGNAALHTAAEEGHAKIVQTLVSARANVELINDFGLKPIALVPQGTEAYRILDKLSQPLCEVRRCAVRQF